MYLVARRGWRLLCRCAVVCLKVSEEVIQLVQQRRDAVAGLWWGLVVRVGLYPLATGSVAEMMGYPPGVLPLSFSDAMGHPQEEQKKVDVERNIRATLFGLLPLDGLSWFRCSWVMVRTGFLITHRTKTAFQLVLDGIP